MIKYAFEICFGKWFSRNRVMKSTLILDNRINTAKERPLNQTGHIWNLPEFDVSILPADQFLFLMSEVHEYLRYVRHLCGKKSRVVLVNDF